MQQLESGKVKAFIYMPDPNTGHYRGSRFDWSGMIGRLEYDGHVLWDEWNPIDDPTGDHDNAVGPAMEFGMNSPLGYDNAKPGEGFIKIGVGVLKKPDDGKPYFFRDRYSMVDTGTWTTGVADDRRSVHFVQHVDRDGTCYAYNKWVSVGEGVLTIKCQLTNEGERPIVTDVYNHNFFRPDGKGFEPPLNVMFDQPVTRDPKSKLADAVSQNEKGDTFTVTQPPTKSVWAALTYDPNRAPRTFTLTKGRLKMTVTHDFAPSKYVLYGLPEFIAVEPFLEINLPPGKSVSWSYTYRFIFED